MRVLGVLSEGLQTASKMLTAVGCCRLGWRVLFLRMHLSYCKSMLGTSLWLKEEFWRFDSGYRATGFRGSDLSQCQRKEEDGRPVRGALVSGVPAAIAPHMAQMQTRSSCSGGMRISAGTLAPMLQSWTTPWPM